MAEMAHFRPLTEKPMVAATARKSIFTCQRVWVSWAGGAKLPFRCMTEPAPKHVGWTKKKIHPISPGVTMRQVINTKKRAKEHFWDEVSQWKIFPPTPKIFSQKRVDPESEPDTSFSGLRKREEVTSLQLPDQSVLRRSRVR